MSETVKILVVRFSSIGDIVLTTPVIRCLKEQVYGEAEIHYLTKQQFLPLLAENPYLTKVHTIKKHVNEVMEELMNEGFHYIVDLHKNLRSAQVKRGLKVLPFTFNKLNFEKWLLVNTGINRMPDVHIVDRYFEAVQALDVKNDGKGLDYFIPDAEQVDLKSMALPGKECYLTYAIGGNHAGKKLLLHKMIEVCEGVTYPLVLLGGKEDMDAAKEISAVCPRVIDKCGALTINQSASVIEQSAGVITHDTGLMHIASAFRKKIVSIWGATVPAFGMSPYMADPASVIVEARHLKFRPTSKLGNRNSKKERRTVEEIDVEEIIDAANGFMKGSTPQQH